LLTRRNDAEVQGGAGERPARPANKHASIAAVAPFAAATGVDVRSLIKTICANADVAASGRRDNFWLVVRVAGSSLLKQLARFAALEVMLRLQT
jgi:hypothetical protein